MIGQWLDSLVLTLPITAGTARQLERQGHLCKPLARAGGCLLHVEVEPSRLEQCRLQGKGS